MEDSKKTQISYPSAEIIPQNINTLKNTLTHTSIIPVLYQYWYMTFSSSSWSLNLSQSCSKLFHRISGRIRLRIPSKCKVLTSVSRVYFEEKPDSLCKVNHLCPVMNTNFPLGYLECFLYVLELKTTNKRETTGKHKQVFWLVSKQST